jgi:plastocyanin
MRRDLLEVDRKSGGLRHVVVYLARTDGHAAPVKAPAEKAVMDQQNHEFIPRVIAVLLGQPVVFSNSDPANHNVRTTASERKNQFNVFTGVDGRYEHQFVVEPEYRPVRLGCDIHPWMTGWVFVFDHPLFAVTDERGRFRISQVPQGDYKLQIIQPDVRYREQRNVSVRDTATNRIEIVIEQKDLRP